MPQDLDELEAEIAALEAADDVDGERLEALHTRLRQALDDTERESSAPGR